MIEAKAKAALKSISYIYRITVLLTLPQLRYSLITDLRVNKTKTRRQKSKTANLQPSKIPKKS